MRLLLFLAFAAQISAQTLEVSGEVEKPLKLTSADLELLPHQTIDATEHSGEKAQFTGVPLHQILKSAGVPMGEQMRGPALSLYVVVSASDGYQAVYALPELDPLANEGPVILAEQKNGKPLDAATGPLRIVMPREKRHARWIRQVIKIEVRRAAKP
ncbi:molybdopterin-dependent oxidoreductase [Prosthecobacter sp.]|uniref:molybdopterin-dependent oxidoreductase n=1 Tax=Prosthecobacter sp. TaxID=1965333 RepID=UPI0037841015